MTGLRHQGHADVLAADKAAPEADGLSYADRLRAAFTAAGLTVQDGE